MLDRERGIILSYLYHLLDYAGHRSGIAQEVSSYLRESDLLQQSANQRLCELLDEYDSLEKMPRRQFMQLATKLKTIVQKSSRAHLKKVPSILEENLELLTNHLGLNEIDRAFVGLTQRHSTYSGFQRCFNEITRAHLPAIDACAAALGVEITILNDHLNTKGKLIISGVIKAKSSTTSDLDDLYEVQDSVAKSLLRTHDGLAQLLETILGQPATATLSWDDFSHLGQCRDKIQLFLSEALRKKLPGVNILLWGKPGTGKTEFCKSLAAQMGVNLYSVGESDEDGDAPNRNERMNSFRLLQSLLRTQNDTLLMFDEMDDLFEGGALARLFGGKANFGSKVFINRLLESNPVPAIWIINDIEPLDEAFIRRMSLVLEVKVPPPSTREKIWLQVLEKNGVTLPTDEMKTLAELNIPPSVIDSAAHFTRQTGGGAEDFRFAAHGIIHAMRGGRPLPKPEKNEIFLPELTHADLNLEHMTQKLIYAQSRAFSLCIYGPPGTGKSAYLRYLAEQLGMPVLFKRASDLLDMFVGGSEKQIASAFAEAQDLEAFLIFDEADSLLSDRRNAVRSWEISQVNEMLTWMERHPLPFACTTNLKERLDPASLRRFTFKGEFSYMTADQVLQAFKHFFGCSTPERYNTLHTLTPGDFAVVRSKAKLLGALDDTEELATMLAAEAKAKQDNPPARRIGYSC